jgi:hypothetical protein
VVTILLKGFFFPCLCQLFVKLLAAIKAMKNRIQVQKPQGVGSSGKGIGLCGSPMRSKAQMSLGANNFLGPASWRSRSITRSMWRGRFTWV